MKFIVWFLLKWPARRSTWLQALEPVIAGCSTASTVVDTPDLANLLGSNQIYTLKEQKLAKLASWFEARSFENLVR